MADILDVAKYITERQGSLTTMKLQKLSYYSQAWHLVWDGVPLFDEEFRAWGNGPVSTVLFHEFKGKFLITTKDFQDTNYKLSEDEIETIESVLDFYGERDGNYLSELTHLEEPWIKARKGFSPGQSCSVVIQKAWMQEYYGGI